MKLLLIQPPVEDFYDTELRLQPLGLCYLKGAVKKHHPDVEVAVKDYHQGWGRRTIAVPEELRYLEDYYAGPDSSPFSAFHHYYHFGAPFETIAEEIARERPDLIGISSLFSPYYREVLRCAEAIKKKRNIPILIGGPHASACPEMMLHSPHIDFVIRKEGEKPLVEFLKAWEKPENFEKIPNLCFKKNGRLVFNEVQENYPVTEIPFPDFSDLKKENYVFENRPMAFILTSRGCPHRCNFCPSHQIFGHAYRRRPLADILSEIRSRFEDGYRVFDFEDDNLTFLRDDMALLCEALHSEFAGKDVQFLAMNGISYESLDAGLLRLMRQAGFTHLNISLVSSDEAVLRASGRSHTVEKYLEVVRKAHRLGFKIVSYQILGLPGESLDSMIESLVLGAGLPVLLGASPFYLSPGSPIAESFPPRTENDIFKARLSALAIESKEVTREVLYTLFVTTRILNFLKGFEPGESPCSLEKVLALATEAGGRKALGAELLRNLLSGKGLAARHGEKRFPLSRFKVSLFWKIWDKMNGLTTRSGTEIVLRSKNSAPRAGASRRMGWKRDLGSG